MQPFYIHIVSLMKFLVMKKILCFLVCSLSFTVSFAQVYEAKVEHHRKKHVAAVVEVPYSQEIVEAAIKDYMAKKGYRDNSDKGMMTFKGVKIDSYNRDIHFKVERKSRKEKEYSLVHVVVTRENESLVQHPSDDKSGLNDAKSYLNGMIAHFEARHLEAEIDYQDKSVKKEEKKLDVLKEDQFELEKKIKALQEKLDLNMKDQELQKAAISNQKTILDAMKGKRRS